MIEPFSPYLLIPAVHFSPFLLDKKRHRELDDGSSSVLATVLSIPPKMAPPVDVAFPNQPLAKILFFPPYCLSAHFLPDRLLKMVFTFLYERWPSVLFSSAPFLPFYDNSDADVSPYRPTTFPSLPLSPHKPLEGVPKITFRALSHPLPFLNPYLVFFYFLSWLVTASLFSSGSVFFDILPATLPSPTSFFPLFGPTR